MGADAGEFLGPTGASLYLTETDRSGKRINATKS